jgi:hypothetical protein
VLCDRNPCGICARLSDAMTAIVDEGRYLATSDTELCGRAGVEASELVAHMGSVEGCLVGAFQRGMDRLHARAASAFDAPGPWQARLRTTMRAVVDELASTPGLARLCYVDALELGGIEVWRRREDVRQRVVELLEREDDEGPRLRFELIVGALHMGLHRHALAQAEWSEELADELVDQVLVFEPVSA